MDIQFRILGIIFAVLKFLQAGMLDWMLKDEWIRKLHQGFGENGKSFQTSILIFPEQRWNQHAVTHIFQDH